MLLHFDKDSEWIKKVEDSGLIVVLFDEYLFAHHPECLKVIGSFNKKCGKGFLNLIVTPECRIECNEFSKCKVNRR